MALTPEQEALLNAKIAAELEYLNPPTEMPAEYVGAPIDMPEEFVGRVDEAMPAEYVGKPVAMDDEFVGKPIEMDPEFVGKSIEMPDTPVVSGAGMDFSNVQAGDLPVSERWWEKPSEFDNPQNLQASDLPASARWWEKTPPISEEDAQFINPTNKQASDLPASERWWESSPGEAGAPQRDGVITGPNDPDLVDAIDSTPSPEEAAQGIVPKSASGKLGVRERGFGPDTGQGAIWAKGYEQFGENDARLRQMAEGGQLETALGYQRLEEANRSKAAIEEKYYADSSALLEEKVNYLRESADLDQKMYAQAQAESKAILDDAMQQFAAVRSMAIKSPMGEIPGWQFAGATLAAAAQGFLAAQGINIDVIGQLNRWEDMSIREQQRRIDQAEKGAQDTMNLWQIAKERSRDDLEARLRYRGMMLEQFQVATEVQANRFNSTMARSAAEITNAQLGLERNNVLRQIRDNYEQQRLGNMKAMRDEMHMRVMERFRDRELQIQAARAAAEIDMAKKKADKPGPSPVLIQDTRNTKRDPKTGKPVTGGLYVAYIDPAMPDGIQSKAWDTVTNAQQLHDNLQTGLERLRDLYTKLESGASPGWWRKRTDPAYKRFDAERIRTMGDIRKFMTGLAGSIPEDNRILDQLRDDYLFETGEARLPKLMNDIGEWGRGRFENALKIPGVKVLPPEQRFYERQVQVDPTTATLYGAQDQPRIPTTAEHLAGAATESTRYVDREPSALWKADRPVGFSKDENPFDTAGRMMKDATTGGKAPLWAIQLEDMARLALDPEAYLKGKATTDPTKEYHEDPRAAANQVIGDLAKIANGQPLKTGQPAPPADRVAYAKKLLDLFDNNPDELKRLLSE